VAGLVQLVQYNQSV